jgi:hypothetical protein
MPLRESLTMNILTFHAPERPVGDAEAAAKFHAEEAVRELIRLHGRTKTEFLLSSIFETEAKVVRS